MAGVQAHPETFAAAGGGYQLGQFLERAAESAAGTRRVLEVQRASVSLRQRLLDDLARALDRLFDVALLRRAGMQDDPGGADPRADAQ